MLSAKIENYVSDERYIVKFPLSKCFELETLCKIQPKIDRISFKSLSKTEIISPNGIKLDVTSYHITILTKEVEVQKVNAPLGSYRDTACWGKKEFIIYLPTQK